MNNSASATTDLLETVLADLELIIGGVATAQLADPTPCSEWNVEQLRDHILGWLTNFAAGLADPEGKAPNADVGAYRAPADPAQAARSAADLLLKAVRAGAADRPLWLGENAMPGELALGLILWEYQVHGWDLARATGQTWSPPPAASEESLQFAPAMLNDDFQGEGKAFGRRVAVPAKAAPLDQLLGLSGRDPSWAS